MALQGNGHFEFRLCSWFLGACLVWMVSWSGLVFSWFWQGGVISKINTPPGKIRHLVPSGWPTDYGTMHINKTTDDLLTQSDPHENTWATCRIPWSRNMGETPCPGHISIHGHQGWIQEWTFWLRCSWFLGACPVCVCWCSGMVIIILRRTLIIYSILYFRGQHL